MHVSILENLSPQNSLHEANLFRYECLRTHVQLYSSEKRSSRPYTTRGSYMHTKGICRVPGKVRLGQDQARRESSLTTLTRTPTAPRRPWPWSCQPKLNNKTAPKPASNNVMADDVSSLNSDSPQAVRRSTRVRTRTGTAGPGV
jgi:hypothetical protein